MSQQSDTGRPTVYVVDDDHEFADSLTGLLKANGFPATSFSSGRRFLKALEVLSPGAIMLDIKMPGLDGLGVLGKLEQANLEWPVVIMTGHGDIPLAVKCIQRGAIGFIEKPFEEARLLGALSEAMHVLETQARTRAERCRHQQLLSALTAREREVLEGLALGRTNKQIALQLELSVRTVEMHRAKLFRRLGVKTTSEAIGFALRRPGS